MANIKLLLSETIKNVGKVGDIVEVSPGFARNYLLPRDLAVEPTRQPEEGRGPPPGNRTQEREHREQQAALIEQLTAVEITLNAGPTSRPLFGSVTATDIAKALAAQGFNIDADDVNLPGKLHRIDNYAVQIKFAEDLATDVKVWITPDPESKALIDAAAKAKAAATTEEPAAKS